MINLVDKSNYDHFICDLYKFDLNNPFYNVFVYVENNVILGYLSFELIYDRIEIDNFFVNKEHRNIGIGSLLMKKLVDFGKEKGVKNITLEVMKDNDIAISIYNKYGFVSKAIRKNYYNGIDGILMEKEMV